MNRFLACAAKAACACAQAFVSFGLVADTVDGPCPWVTDEERETVRGRVCGYEFQPGTPEGDAKRFYSNAEKTEFVEFNYDEAKAGELGRDYTLEDPLTFADGRKVKSAEDWSVRRKEILGIFEREVYGKLPPKPTEMTFEIVSEKIPEIDATRNVVIGSSRLEMGARLRQEGFGPRP